MDESSQSVSSESLNFKKDKTAFYSLIIFLSILVIAGFSGYLIYQKFNPKQVPSSVETIIKTEISDGKIIPPPGEADPIVVNLSDISTEDGKLTGKIHLENKADYGYGEVLFIASLKGKQERIKSTLDGKEIEIMADPWPMAEKDSELFSLKPLENKDLTLEMDYPKGAPGEDFTLSVRIVGKDENPLASSQQEIKVKPEGGFLMVHQNTCKISANKTSYESWMGPNINPGETVNGSCDVTNTGKVSVSAKPYIRAAERFVIGYADSEPINIDNQEAITWKPGETKTVTIPLPPQVKPQTYQAVMQLVDQNNLALSSYAPFRYVVRGASAVVRTAQLKSTNIKEGDDFEVDIWAAPSVDLYWRINAPPNTPLSLQKAYSLTEGTPLKNPTLVVSVNSASTVCAQKTVGLPIRANDWKPVTLQLKAVTDCKDPIIIAKVQESGVDLAQLQKKYLSPEDTTLNKISKNKWTPVLPVLLLAGFLILVVISVAGFLLFRRKSPVPPITGLILVLASALAIYSISTFLVNKALATVIINPPGTVSLTRAWNHTVGFYGINGGNNNLTYSGGAVQGILNLHVACPACVNCVMGYLVEVWIDGGQATIAGQPGGYYMIGMTTNPSLGQDLSTGNFSATKPGTDLSTGQHSVEIRVVAVEITNFQVSARSTSNPDGNGDNCGYANDTCYGRLAYTWGTAPSPSPTPPPPTPVPTFTIWGTLSSSQTIFPGENIQLLNSSNVIIDQKITDSQGKYTFVITSAGVYSVKLATVPANYTRVGSDTQSFKIIQGVLNGQQYLWLDNTSR